MQLRLGGAWQAISGAKVRASGAWRTIVAVRIFSGGAWRLVANWTPPSPPPSGGGSGGGGGGGTITLSISPNPFTGRDRLTPGDPQIRLSATPSGGLTPYTYSWTAVSGAVTFDTPTLANTIVHGADGVNATVRCTVTDSLGASTHADASGTFFHFEDTGTL